MQYAPEELSNFDLEDVINNGAESYHAKLNSIIKTSHLRIWNLMIVLSNIISDYDYEIARLKQGGEITRSRKKRDRIIDERRTKGKEKLSSGNYTPMQFLESISHSLLTSREILDETSFLDNSGESDQVEEPESPVTKDNQCLICLLPLNTTWIFMPCRHANCTQCSDMIEQL